ncbi:MAG: hypothetical protein IPN48_14240 [Sphingomonadales bacterium]|nr:hypothetical protein [Sphingomonadales bacterium]
MMIKMQGSRTKLPSRRFAREPRSGHLLNWRDRVSCESGKQGEELPRASQRLDQINACGELAMLGSQFIKAKLTCPQFRIDHIGPLQLFHWPVAISISVGAAARQPTVGERQVTVASWNAPGDRSPL